MDGQHEAGQHEAVEVLRDVWRATGQSGADIAEHGGHGTSCKRMANVGFDDMADAETGEVHAAWRDRLAREGKLNPEGGSVRDLVLGTDERGR